MNVWLLATENGLEGVYTTLELAKSMAASLCGAGHRQCQKPPVWNEYEGAGPTWISDDWFYISEAELDALPPALTAEFMERVEEMKDRILAGWRKDMPV